MDNDQSALLEPVQQKIVVTPDPNFEVWITGEYHDLIDIVSDRALLWRDYIRNDSRFDLADVHVSPNIVVVRAGRNNDLAVLYGIRYEGKPTPKHVDVLRFYVRDGANIDIELTGSEVFIIYGNHKDLRTRFKFSEADGWYRSRGNGRDEPHFPPADQKVETERVP